MGLDQLDAVVKQNGKAVLTFGDLHELIGLDVENAKGAETLYKWGKIRGVSVRVNSITKMVTLGGQKAP